MKIAIIGATGKQGSLLLKEAIERGHEVTAIVRKETTLPNAEVVVKDILALTYDDLKPYEVIIDAFGAWTEETLPLHETSLKHLTDILSGKPNRLLIVGGAGSLYVDATHTIRVMDTADFPDAFKPLAAAMGKAFDELKKVTDVNWTYLSPSANFVADGVRTGSYRSGAEELLTNAAGESEISYADYAIAMLDEAEHPQHVKARFTVVSK